MEKHNLFADENRAQALFIALEKQALEQKTLLSELKTWMQQIEKTLKGDVIEQGGVKNVHIYNYDPHSRAPYGMVHEPDPTLLPEKLQTPEADYMRDQLISAGMIDSMWQPVGLSGSERCNWDLSPFARNNTNHYQLKANSLLTAEKNQSAQQHQVPLLSVFISF